MRQKIEPPTRRSNQIRQVRTQAGARSGHAKRCLRIQAPAQPTVRRSKAHSPNPPHRLSGTRQAWRSWRSHFKIAHRALANNSGIVRLVRWASRHLTEGHTNAGAAKAEMHLEARRKESAAEWILSSGRPGLTGFCLVGIFFANLPDRATSTANRRSRTSSG